MSLQMRIGIRFLMMANFFVAFNFIYEGSLWHTDVERHADFVEELWEANAKADILYLGDCSDGFFRDSDASFKSIAEMTDELMPDQKVMSVSRNGFHGPTYYKLLQAVPDTAHMRTVVVTMNLRSFSPIIRLHKNLNKVNKQLQFVSHNPPLINRMLVGLRGYDYTEPNVLERQLEKAWHEPYNAEERELAGYESFQLWHDAVLAETSPEDSTLTSKHLTNYGFPFNPESHPIVTAFDSIASMANQRGWRLVYLILPEKSSEAKRMVGPELDQYMRWKKDWLVNHYYRELGVPVLDGFDLLLEKDFVEELPNSHYTSFGRQQICELLVQHLTDD